MARIPIQAKLAACLSVPLLPLLVLSVIEVRDAARDTAEVRRETQLASTASGPSSIVGRLFDERSWAVLELTGLESSYEAPVTGYDETRQATDDAIEVFRAEVEAKGGAVEATYHQVVDSLSDIEQIRREIDAFTEPRSTANMPFSTGIYDRYAELIDRILGANSLVSQQMRDRELRKGTEIADLASRQAEIVANLSRQVLVDATLSEGGIDTAAEIRASASLLSSFDRLNTQIEGTTAPFDELVREHNPRDRNQALHDRVEEALETGTVGDLNGFLDATVVPPGEGFPRLRDEVFDVVSERADTLEANATTRQRIFVLLALVCFLLAGTMIFLISRSITRPLRSLTRQAQDMARRRLPDTVRDILSTRLGDDVVVPAIEPVTIRSRDEVGDVSGALNTVQESALHLAVEQAVLRRNIADSFVSLGRRNQHLLGRQLDFITELELNETDPETLAGLFRLDHLATRMRRNAESLLVLAGLDPPRKWTAPVRITDVIRASLGEVEDYERVTVTQVEPATIVGSTAADLAHLVAELVENALSFSSPLDAVEIRGLWRVPEGYRLTIADQGLGMAEPAIAQANRRLAGTESFTVAPSKYLGHYVAGHLAARYGIQVQLHASFPRGIVATVDLPAHVTEAPPRIAQATRLVAEFQPQAARQPAHLAPAAPRASGYPASLPPAAS
jgi:HAMP domain-containing protein